MVNLELYRIFIAIYRAGTISKAAVLCDITQPAASQQLASLEKTLKVKLFERTPRAMVATNEGHELYTKVSDSFDWLDFVSQDFVMQREEEEALLSVGVPLAYYKEVLLEKLSNLSFRVHVHFGTDEELIKELENGKIDLLIGNSSLENRNYISEHILNQKFSLVGHSRIESPQNGFDKLQDVISWLRKKNWVSYDMELSLIRRCFKAEYGVQPNIKPKFVVPNFHLMLETIKHTEALAMVPEYLAIALVQQKQIQLFHTFTKHTEQLYLSYEHSAKNSILIKEFKQRLLT